MAMNHAQMAAFLQNMTGMALTHVAQTPNVPDIKGGMSHDKKLAFVQGMAKHGLMHLAGGGDIPGSPLSSNSLNPQDVSKDAAANSVPGHFEVNAAQDVISQIPKSPSQGSYAGSPGTNNSATNPNTGVVGSINGALGLNNQFVAQGANLNAGTNGQQIDTAYGGVQGGLTQQQGLATASMYGTNQGLGNQAMLANQLNNQIAGVGPNPAQAALNQSTGQNIDQQAALMASQRGAGGNAGLLASQAARQGGALQQQAVGQSATLQAQQQIAAEQAQAGLAATQVGQGATAIQNLNQQQQNEQNILQGANTSLNNANVSMQSNLNNSNSQTSAANQNAAGKTFGGIVNGASSISSMFADGGSVDPNTPEWSSSPSDTSSGPSVPSTSTLPAPAPDSSSGGGGGGGGSALSLLALLADGGTVQKPMMMAGGGYLAPTPLVVSQPNGPQSAVGQWINTQANPSSGPAVEPTATLVAPTPDDPKKDQGTKKQTSGGSMQTGQTQKLGADSTMSNLGSGTMMAYKGGTPKLMKSGGAVKAGPGQEAEVPGDSLKNDKVPAMLSAGELVIDRKTMMDPGPLGQMARALKMHIDARNKKGAK